MLHEFRMQGWSFERAWSSAIQRFRVQPTMSADEARELTEWKRQLTWARPYYEWAYTRSDDPPPQLSPPRAVREPSVRGMPSEALRAA